MEFKAYVTNLGKYNEGLLIGEWVNFPASEEEIEDVFARIGIDGEYYEEYFITDYDGIWAGSMKDEYISIERLNDIAETLQEFYEDGLAAALEYWNLDDVLEMNPDDLMLYSDVHNEYDLGYYWIEESGCYNLGDDILSLYFDYEAFGCDIAIEANGGFTSEGFIEYIEYIG